MDSSSTKDMDSLVISGDTLAAEDSSGLAGDPVLDVLLSDSTREELDGWAVTLGLDPSDYKDLYDSQSVDELATLDRYHHFHGHSGLCA